MSEDYLSYERMVERALRSVVIEALGQVAESGLSGAHHLYVTFATAFPGVEIPDHLHEKFPEEMTIVLQHQFWDLTLEEDRFYVTLSFNDIRERLVVPYTAIRAFADPSVNFGLQLKFEGDAEMTAPASPEAEAGAAVKEISGPVDAEETTADDVDDKVVTLDAFRKK